MICQAIVTKYFGPTNTRGSRIKASASAGSKTVSYDHALNIADNHAAAAKAFAEKMEWEGKWFGGGMPDGSGNVLRLHLESLSPGRRRVHGQGAIVRNPETTTRLFDQTTVEDDIAEVVQNHFGTPQRQASDALALVALALFIGTAAILLQLVAN